jgi:hypothetical protein
LAEEKRFDKAWTQLPGTGKNMSKAGVGRTLIAVIASYVAFVTMVVLTELFLSRLASSFAARQRLPYFVGDVVIQCLYTVLAGYMCCVIAQRSQRIAMAGLIGIGLVLGAVLLVTSWKSEPHWYGIVLYVVYAPCVDRMDNKGPNV